MDADGDYKMRGTNALLAAFENSGIKKDGLIAGLNDLSNKGLHKENGSNDGLTEKPRALWRSEEEFYNLIKKRLCLRCKKPGHKSPY